MKINKLKTSTEEYKNRVADLSQALKSNKEMIWNVIEMSEKLKSQLVSTQKSLNIKTQQLERMGKEKDEIIEKLRSNFAMHMNALKFTCQTWGSWQFKTEVWKDGLDKTRFNTNAHLQDSEGNKFTSAGSKILQSHFESFCDMFGSNKKEVSPIDKQDSCPDEVNDTSLKTYRVIVKETHDDKDQFNFVDALEQDGSVLINDFSPTKIQYTSENEGKFWV